MPDLVSILLNFLELSHPRRYMLLITFRHIRGISAKKERQFWAEGVRSWDDLELRLNPQRVLFNEPSRPVDILTAIRQSKQAFELGNADFFAEQLERQEHYRIACSFPNETLFLDIETTGLSRYYDYITLVGWSFGNAYDVYVRGDSDTSLRQALGSAKAIVTFNGAIFDLPFLRQEFHQIPIPKTHIDLRFLIRRAGLSGGQKLIEQKLGISRSAGIADMSGEAAPVLWHRYRRGDVQSLKRLIEYNHADIEGMKDIFDYAVTKLAEAQQLPIPRNNLQHFSKVRSELVWFRETSLSGGTEIRPYSGDSRPQVMLDDLTAHSPELRVRVIGIDLSGSEQRASGWCLLDGRSAVTKLVKTDDEIVSETLKQKPHVISIDSPLSLPTGRMTVEDTDPARQQHGIMRHCERILKRRGVNVYPALIPSMQKLTARGIRLAAKFRGYGVPVIESYPGAAQDIMNIPRKRASLEFLESGLAEFGIEGPFLVDPVSHDELDAITAAIVGVFFWSGRFERLGEAPHGEEALIIPDLRTDPTQWRTRQVIGISGPTSAGKTTAARYLASQGYHYGRYSEIIERLAVKQKKKPTRETLQRVGERIHKKMGQRWLARQLLQSVPQDTDLVIDGMRFPDDHAFWAEIVGPGFRHIHITAPSTLREQRYLEREAEDPRNFDAVDNHPVEREARVLVSLADVVLENVDSVDSLYSKINTVVNNPRRNS